MWDAEFGLLGTESFHFVQVLLFRIHMEMIWIKSTEMSMVREMIHE